MNTSFEHGIWHAVEGRGPSPLAPPPAVRRSLTNPPLNRRILKNNLQTVSLAPPNARFSLINPSGAAGQQPPAPEAQKPPDALPAADRRTKLHTYSGDYVPARLSANPPPPPRPSSLHRLDPLSDPPPPPPPLRAPGSYSGRGGLDSGNALPPLRASFSATTASCLRASCGPTPPPRKLDPGAILTPPSPHLLTSHTLWGAASAGAKDQRVSASWLSPTPALNRPSLSTMRQQPGVSPLSPFTTASQPPLASRFSAAPPGTPQGTLNSPTGARFATTMNPQIADSTTRSFNSAPAGVAAALHRGPSGNNLAQAGSVRLGPAQYTVPLPRIQPMSSRLSMTTRGMVVPMPSADVGAGAASLLSETTSRQGFMLNQMVQAPSFHAQHGTQLLPPGTRSQYPAMQLQRPRMTDGPRIAVESNLPRQLQLPSGPDERRLAEPRATRPMGHTPQQVAMERPRFEETRGVRRAPPPLPTGGRGGFAPGPPRYPGGSQKDERAGKKWSRHSPNMSSELQQGLEVDDDDCLSSEHRIINQVLKDQGITVEW